ncbi:MAG: hypothetical protein MJZ34_13565 [Paludibacteraceae bacterium]|nr:hypothetical protein [Paludibacteraceae bacterium]
MAYDATKVSTGKPAKAGAIYRADLGATLPTNTSDALTGFTHLGYVSDAGVTNSNSPQSDTTKAWGGDIVLNLQTEKDDTWSFTLIEAMNDDVLKAVYGSSNVDTSGSETVISANSDDQADASWVIDMILKNGKLKRIVLPNAKITALGDIVYSDSDAIGYEITLSCVPDENGNTHYEYITK